jgi:hypothetical protein
MATLDELAAQFGGSTQPFGMTQEAPEGVRTPWQGLPPARADMARQRAFEQAQKYLQENAAVVNQGGEVLGELDRFGELNRKSATGALYEGSLASFMPESLRGSDEKVMQSITADLAPKKRIAGSGTTSDKDIALYLQSLPDISKGGDVNQQIREGYKKQFDRANAKLQFMQGYFDQYGHLNGADVMWQKEKSKLLNPSSSNANQPAMANQDQQAIEWANSNPNDPRATLIKQRLGVR